MKRPLALLLLMLAAAGAPLVVGCRALDLGSDEQYTWPELRDAELGAMVNVHVCGSLWLGGSPRPEDLELASRRSINTIISSLTPAEALDYDWVAVSERLGLVPVDLELSAEGFDDSQIDLFLTTLEAEVEGDALLFCGNGQHSATLFAIYRVVTLGVPLDTAIREARRIGMKPGQPEAFVRSQVLRLRPDLALGEAAAHDQQGA